MKRMTLQKMKNDSSKCIVEFNRKILKDSIAKLRDKILGHLRKS